MHSKNNNSNKETIRELERKIAPVLVVNNSSLKPYVESFQYYPENIYQQPLGILLGFFEIKEYSEDSAYVVNFLNSVLKKEYYINPKRPVTESLDSALHKVNMALSELAKHGNVNWLGKLDGAVCILEKNNLHFSVAGAAKVMLYRNDIFNDISEGLASDSLEPHPLKTFTNVSSGRLENKDKVLITSEDLFQIFTLEKLTRHAERFESDKFVQFLKTALSNELEMASVLVVDISTNKTTGKKIVSHILPEIKEEAALDINVFSQQAFAEKIETASKPNLQAILEELTEQKDAAYTDKKTGHIYVQGQQSTMPHNSAWQLFLTSLAEHATDINLIGKKWLRKQFIASKKFSLLFRESAALKIAEMRAKKTNRSATSRQADAEIFEKDQLPKTAEAPTETRHIDVTELVDERLPEPKEEITPPATKQPEIILSETKQEEETQKQQTTPTEEEPVSISVHRNMNHILEEEDFQIGQTMSVLEKIAAARRNLLSAQQPDSYTKFESPDTETDTKKEASAAKISWQKRLHSLLPNFTVAKNIFARFDKKQRLYLLLTVAAIIILPLVFNKFFSDNKKQSTVEIPAPPQSLQEKLAQDKNIRLNAQVAKLSSTEAKNVLLSDNMPYAITSTNIVSLDENNSKTFSLPLDAEEKLVSSTFMQDLKMILLLTDKNRIISFSPISQQFKDNSISIPTGTNLEFPATYLTYLYLVNPTDNQVYRYPRAEGGFGEKTNWLKDSLDLKNITSLTIDDSIYFVQDNKLNKLFKGKKESVEFAASQTPVTFTSIFTTIDLDNLYVLDAKNARVIVYAKTGEIVKQYFNEALKNASALAVSEKNAAVYVTTKDGVLKLSL